MTSIEAAAAASIRAPTLDAYALRSRHDALKRPYDLGDHEILERQRMLESNARSYPRRLPIALARAKGVYVEDVAGRVFIDCLSAAGTLVLGHNHPVPREAMERTLRDELPLQTLDLSTPLKDRFVQDVFSLLPGELASRAKIQFCGPAGTDGVEAALKLVKTATGRAGMLAFHGGYHGMSHGALSLMGNLGPKRDIGGLMPEVQFLPYPYAYRCPFGIGGEAGEAAGLRYIQTVLTDPESGVRPPAGMILEAVQGEGGVVPASDRWMRGLRRITRAAGVPMILDEVQTGLGRTGRFFAFQHADIVPDVLVLSKAIGGGLPIAVVVYDESLDRWKPGAHAGTFRGNQLAMAAGSATIQFVRTERLDQRAEAMGQRLRNHLLALQRSHACIGDVRGRGLMLGMEIIDPTASVLTSATAIGPAPGAQNPRPPHGRLASALQQACLRRGLIIELGGRDGSTMRFLPPLIISEPEIDHVAEILDAAFRSVPLDPIAGTSRRDP
jgi:diaminobutyrate-2-oxoglutarate transaminase